MGKLISLWISSMCVVSIMPILTVSARPNTIEDSLGHLQDSILNIQKNLAGQLMGIGQGTITNFPFVPNVHSKHQNGQGVPLGAFMLFNGIPQREIMRHNHHNIRKPEPQNTNIQVPQDQRLAPVFEGGNRQFGPKYKHHEPPFDEAQSSASATASASSSSYGGNSNHNNNHPNGNSHPLRNPHSNGKPYNLYQQDYPSGNNHEPLPNHDYPHGHNHGNNNNGHPHGHHHGFHHGYNNQYGGNRPNYAIHPNQDGSVHNSNPAFNPSDSYPAERERPQASQHYNHFTTNVPDCNHPHHNVVRGKPGYRPSNTYNSESCGGSHKNDQFIPNEPNNANIVPTQNVPVQNENSGSRGSDDLDYIFKPVIESIDDIVPPNNPEKPTINQNTNSSSENTATSGNNQESLEKVTTIKETKTVVKKTDGKVTSVEESGGGDQIYSIDVRNDDGGDTDQIIPSVSMTRST